MKSTKYLKKKKFENVDTQVFIIQQIIYKNKS